jgi:hypothetical protein
VNWMPAQKKAWLQTLKAAVPGATIAAVQATRLPLQKP